ncbi:MAG: hypothetical protein Q7V53_03375 [Caldisericota bacterium]|nr:hypothetical protein [Caldisericota bacterium]
MPNGHTGTSADWQRIEAPLLELDPLLETFARRHHVRLAKNERDWPSRSLTREFGIRRLMQIHVHDPGSPTFDVWLCASQDCFGKGYWKNRYVAEDVDAHALAVQMAHALGPGYAELMSWRRKDLVYATDLG